MPTTRISRRHFLQTSALVTSATFTPRLLRAQAAPAPAPDRVAQMRAAAADAKITTEPLRGNVSALLGSGGNIAVLPGKQGKLLVDSGFSTSRPQITTALEALGADPLTHLVNTHWHYDHTDGNEWMHSAGATITAHENTRQRMSTTQHVAAFDITLPPSPAGALPTDLFTATKTIHHNGELLTLSAFSPAHTDTDISILFTNAEVLHLGDTFFNGIYPFIDYSSGGNIDGMIRAAERSLASVSPKTILIPGHGPIGDRAALDRYHTMLTTVREKVSVMKKQGRSVDEVIAANPAAPFDTTFKPLAPGGFFLKLVYQGV